MSWDYYWDKGTVVFGFPARNWDRRITWTCKFETSHAKGRSHVKEKQRLYVYSVYEDLSQPLQGKACTWKHRAATLLISLFNFSLSALGHSPVRPNLLPSSSKVNVGWKITGYPRIWRVTGSHQDLLSLASLRCNMAVLILCLWLTMAMVPSF